jgi:beta-N-acetylhexosaminidase
LFAERVKPLIVGLEGTTLTGEERRFIGDEQPLGFILFQRNCETPEQVTALTRALREETGRERLYILIDQEGGRVARLRPPHWRDAPACGIFAGIAASNAARACRLTYLNAQLIASELAALGITVDCAPVADLPAPGSHSIIGDRAYGDTPEQVALLAREMAEGLRAGGVLPVLKHIPGHGRAHADSHEELPVVDAPLAELEASDFLPFRALADLPFAMTAHIRYTALDPELPATLSPTVLRYIRERIGFRGLLMSDDVSMKALSGDLGALSRQILAAGCDIVLHCNGTMEEMRRIAAALEPVSAPMSARLDSAWSALPATPDPATFAALSADYDALLARATAQA